ncbi:Chitinase 1 [Actinomortierella ambigua]|nr:Chitinase 1 [Actinomortierella ambigua]
MQRLTLLFSTTLAIVYVTCSALIPSVYAFDRLSKTNVVNYWGQNSVSFSGGTEGDLIEYCQDNTVDALVIAFIYQIENGVPILNLSKHCTDKYPGTPHLRCPKIEQDIQACQARGKAILISIGGASGSHAIQDPAQGRALADQVWQLFLGGSHATRPFGNAILDGVDLDLESGQNAGYVEFVSALRTNYFKTTNNNNARPYLVTAAPQCPYPDQAMKEMLASSSFDMVFVQFYNNYCGMQSYGTSNFNFATWHQWATSTSVNKDVRVLLGVPGGPGAAGSGIIESTQLNTVLADLVARYDHFGGVMMWDAGIAHKSGLASSAKTQLKSGSAMRSFDHHANNNTATTTTAAAATAKKASVSPTIPATTASKASPAAAATGRVIMSAHVRKPTDPKGQLAHRTPESAITHRYRGDRPTATATFVWTMATDYMGRPIKKGSPKWSLKKPSA